MVTPPVWASNDPQAANTLVLLEKGFDIHEKNTSGFPDL